MDLNHAMLGLESAVNTQIRLGAEGMAEVAEQLLEALRPAIRQTLMDVVEATATEISSQLKGQTVDIVMRDGDPTLVVSNLSPTSEGESQESMEARLTLRLPEYLKSLIENEADTSGESINSWVVTALKGRTMNPGGSSVKTTFDI